uniref:Uncharacterized protein n=1 Tax=Panagrellus redivivus TaxID=6233 RepID=A0A7E4VP85_PANRE
MPSNTDLTKFNFSNPIVIAVVVVLSLIFIAVVVIVILYLVGCFNKKPKKSSNARSALITTVSTEQKKQLSKSRPLQSQSREKTTVSVGKTTTTKSTVRATKSGPSLFESTDDPDSEILMFVPKEPDPKAEFEEQNPEMTITDYIATRKLLNQFIFDQFKEHYPELPKLHPSHAELQLHRMYIGDAAQALDNLIESAIAELEQLGCYWTKNERLKVPNEARKIINGPRTFAFVKMFALANEYRDVFEYVFDAEYIERLLSAAPLAVVYVYLIQKRLNTSLRFLVIQILRNRFFDRYKLPNMTPLTGCPHPFELMHAAIADNPKLRNCPQWRTFQASIE